MTNRNKYLVVCFAIPFVLAVALVWFRLTDSVGGNLWWWVGEGSDSHIEYSYLNIGILTVMTWTVLIVIFSAITFAFMLFIRVACRILRVS